MSVEIINPIGGGDEAIWGGITGTLSSQTDLQTALNLKIPYTQNEITEDPTGFIGNPTVTYDSTTRKITLVGTFTAYYQGELVTALIDGWESPAHADVSDNYFLRYDGTNFVFDNVSTDFFQQLQISVVQYQSAYKIALRECHSLMDWRSHFASHVNIGTSKLSGGDFSGYTLASTTAANRRPDISSTTLLDEDLQTINAALTSKAYTQRYLTSTGVKNYTLDAAEIISVTGSQPNYNQWNGSAWVQTAFPVNAYGAIFVLAIPTTSDSGSQKFRYVFVQPQTVSTTLTTIQALTPASLNLGSSTELLPEFNFIGKIIVRYAASNWTLISVEQLKGTKFNQVATQGQFLSSVATTSPISGDGTSLSPIDLDINGLTQKSVLADNDLILIEDSADSYNPKKALKSALAGAGGLTNFTESNYLYSTKYGVKLTPNSAQSNVSVVLQPKGTGAVIAQQPDGTETGGNNRGAKAVDLQTVRSSNTQVASGDYAVIGGGSTNIASSTFAVVAGGSSNTASGYYSVVAGGQTCTASSTNSFIGGGNTNQATSGHSFIGGGKAQKTYLIGQSIIGGYNTYSTVKQSSYFTFETDTSNSTPQEVFIDNLSARAVLYNKQKWGFIFDIVASQYASVNCAYFTRRGIIRRGENAADTVISALDTIGTDFNTLGGGSISITADTANGSLKLEVTGVGSNIIFWVINLQLFELQNP